MEIDWKTFGITIVNLMVLYFILRKLLFKPVTKMMDEREKEIQEGLDLTAKNREEADKIIEKFEQKMQEAYVEARKVLDEAEKRANINYEKVLNQAKDDANKLVERAKKDMENERQHMLQELKVQITGLALSAASKVIGRNMDVETNKKLVEDFIDEEGVA